MKRPFSVILAMTLFLIPLFPEETNPLPGVWTNGSRFVEFSSDGKMRFVLKTYYGFVYEDRAWLPYSVKPLSFAGTDTPATPNADAAVGSDGHSGAFALSIRYPNDKVDAEIPLAVIGDAIFLRFYRKADLSAPVASAAATDGAQSATADRGAGIRASGEAFAGDAGSSAGKGPLDGFWIAAGNRDAIMLYRGDPESEFFTYYFIGSDYYRIRYWATDARPRDVRARFVSREGHELSVPKFIAIGSTLYTCVTSTGKVLRNYESGTFEAKDGALSFKPSAIVYSGTAAAILEPLKYALSGDGTVLALGSPYLARSRVADLTAEIAAHNALRRPPRKPIFGFMKLDFHWDEIARIRNNGKIPAGNAGK